MCICVGAAASLYMAGIGADELGVERRFTIL
jgi:hypothetical protein